MNKLVQSVYVCSIFIFQSSFAISKEVDIPYRSTPGDKGVYRIIDISREFPVVKTLHRRDGPSGTSFSRTEINCVSLLYRDMGNQDDTPKGMKIRPGNWTQFVPGSSKSNLAIAACAHQF